jgi:hypothetical protein
VSATVDKGDVEVVARCRDGLLVDGGTWWAFGRQRGSGGGSGVFVLALTGSLMAGGAIAECVRQLWGAGSWWLAGVFAVTALLLGLEATRELRSIRHARMRAPIEIDLVLDFAAGVATDRSGRVLAPLHALTFDLVDGVLSKSSELWCSWDGGRIVLLRTLFAEGNAAVVLPRLRERRLRVTMPDLLD